MHIADIDEAEKLIKIIQDENNPLASSVALGIRDKWLYENSLGIINFSPEVKHMLQNKGT